MFQTRALKDNVLVARALQIHAQRCWWALWPVYHFISNSKRNYVHAIRADPPYTQNTQAAYVAVLRWLWIYSINMMLKMEVSVFFILQKHRAQINYLDTRLSPSLCSDRKEKLVSYTSHSKAFKMWSFTFIFMTSQPYITLRRSLSYEITHWTHIVQLKHFYQALVSRARENTSDPVSGKLDSKMALSAHRTRYHVRH